MTKIVCVSDVQIGYGSPQIGKLVTTLSQFYDAQSTIIYPVDTSNSKPKVTFKEFSIKEIHIKNPYSPSGRTEYNKSTVKLIEKLEPDVLIICTTFNLPVLFELKSKPKLVIYYYIETAMVYGKKDTEINKKIGNLVDLIIFTEENRAKRFGEICGFQNIPFCIIFNCVNDSENDIIPQGQRNSKFLYQGTIRNDTSPEFFLNEKVQYIPIDIYGNIDATAKHLKLDFLKLHENVKYRGLINSEKLSNIRKYYSYSLTIWNPTTENNLYASPNKFFESIASGVPPISTPNPQCKMLINRYDCGLLMKDWSFESFLETLELSLEYAQTERYENMVKNCIKASREELNWGTQMIKLKNFLKKI